jgi:hypothetical protein
MDGKDGEVEPQRHREHSDLLRGDCLTTEAEPIDREVSRPPGPRHGVAAEVGANAAAAATFFFPLTASQTRTAIAIASRLIPSNGR